MGFRPHALRKWHNLVKQLLVVIDTAIFLDFSKVVERGINRVFTPSFVARQILIDRQIILIILHSLTHLHHR